MRKFVLASSVHSTCDSSSSNMCVVTLVKVLLFPRLYVPNRHELTPFTSRTSRHASESDDVFGPTTRTKMATFVPASCATTAVLSVVPSQSTMSKPCARGSKFQVTVHGEVPRRKKIRAPLFGQRLSSATHSL